MVSKGFEGNRSMIKSIKIKCHDWFKIGNVYKRPYGQCHKLFDVEHVSQKNTKSSTPSTFEGTKSLEI